MRALVFACVFAPAVAWADSALHIPRETCRLLVEHRAAADVAYQPGVDVHGKPVAPADINAGPTLGDNVTIPLTVDLAQQFGLPTGMADGSKATVALVTVDNGRAYLNGQPLDAARQDELAVLCLEANGAPR